MFFSIDPEVRSFSDDQPISVIRRAIDWMLAQENFIGSKKSLLVRVSNKNSFFYLFFVTCCDLNACNYSSIHGVSMA